MDLRHLLKHARWHLGMGAELRRLGLPCDTFLRTYYQTRFQAYFSTCDVFPVVKQFVVRHRITGEKSTLRIRTGPRPADLSDWIVLRGVWAHQDYFHPLIRRCRTILDIGANVGIAAVWFKSLIPDAEVACVEPDPRNLPLARLNLHENGISAKVFECAVAPYRRRARLGIEDFRGKSSLEDTRLYAHRDFVEVETRRVPEILDDLGWPQVDLLKMDIEGMERYVLADGGDWLNRVRLMVLEVHQNTSREELSRLLRPHGWTLQRLGVHEEETYLGMRKA